MAYMIGSRQMGSHIVHRCAFECGKIGYRIVCTMCATLSVAYRTRTYLSSMLRQYTVAMVGKDKQGVPFCGNVRKVGCCRSTAVALNIS